MITNFRKQLPDYLSYLKPLDVELTRIGNPHDGGYLVPVDMISRTNALLSMGLGENWTFDEDWKNVPSHKDSPVHMYDGTVTKESLPNPAFQWPERDLAKMYEAFFEKTPNVKHFREMIGNQPGYTNLATCIQRLKDAMSNKDEELSIMLKVDIEGGEYSILNEIFDNKAIIPCVVAEMHFYDTFRQNFETAMQEILKHYNVVHTHANNYYEPMRIQNQPSTLFHLGREGLPNALEITFVRKDLCPDVGYLNELYKTGLDSANFKGYFDYEYYFEDSSK